jgi:hypothetical protein
MKAWQAAAFGLAAVLIAACDEGSSVPTEASKAMPRITVPAEGTNRSISAGSQNPPSTVPAAYQHYTWLSVSVDVGWNGNMAYGQAIVRYGANNATADIDLSVRNAQGTVLGSNHGSAQASYVFPGDHVLYASTNVTVAQSCGSIAQATAAGSAYDSFFAANQSIVSWGKKSESASNSSAQPVCPAPTPPPPTSPPSGGDGSTPPPTGGATPPPTYEPAPFVPSGHWECTWYFLGTDYAREYCTWYADYDRIPKSPGFALAGRAPSRALISANLPSVFVIVSDQVPADAMAVIERRKQGPFRNVLLVPSSTIRPAVLVAALQALADSRGKHGETPDKDYQTILKGGILDQQIPAAARDYAASFTAFIANAKRGDAGAYGLRPILEIRLGDKK